MPIQSVSELISDAMFSGCHYILKSKVLNRIVNQLVPADHDDVNSDIRHKKNQCVKGEVHVM